MAKTTQWLNAILDYMKKAKLITSTVHTHPPNGIGGANSKAGDITESLGYIATWQVGRWAVQEI